MQNDDEMLSKVPEVTLGFWVIKILATTLGETGGDLVTMTWMHADAHPHNGGYLIGSGIFLGVFVAAVIAQILTKKFSPWIYWLAIVASTTVGTAMADFFDRSLGIGYTGGSSILLACVLCSLAIWYFTLGSINVQTVATPKVEIFYWVTITFSQTLGTALGDWMADSTGLGYEGGALVFCAGLAVLAALYYWTRIGRLPVLGGFHPNATARCDGRRLSGQADEPWRPGSQSSFGVGGDPRRNRCAYFGLAAKAGTAPRIQRSSAGAVTLSSGSLHYPRVPAEHVVDRVS